MSRRYARTPPGDVHRAQARPRTTKAARTVRPAGEGVDVLDDVGCTNDPRARGVVGGVFLEGFPDLHLEVQDSAADEEMVAQRILFTGTHTGPFRGLPATGRRVRFSGLEINRMVDGKVAEHWFQMDAVTLFEQLGLRVVPGPRLLPRLVTSAIGGLFANARRSARP